MDAMTNPEGMHAQGPPVGTVCRGDPDLEAVLAAWQTATERLQRTHETLRSEVCRLTDELEVKNRELARKNRLADLGQIASHVAHEVRNSLAPITLYMSLLRRRLGGEPASLNIVEKIDAGFTALEATVNDLLHFTAQRSPAWRRFDLHELIRDVCDSLAPQLSAQGIETAIDAPQPMTVCADRDMLRRAVLNLALNALDAMPDGGELIITACPTFQGFELEVADTGQGIPEEALPQLFEPFFTTKSGGTGLGLAIVDRIAAAHRGDVAAANCAEGGAAITLRFPRRLMEAAA
jgi:signal transduction histidine kinase